MIGIPGQQVDFSYDDDSDGFGRDPAGLPARVAIYAERPGMRGLIAQDLAGAGFHTIDGGALCRLLDGPIALLGDVVLVDCPAVDGGTLDGGTLAALARLDMRAARVGAQLVVSTSFEALDDVFAALDQSDPQILVQPSRAERVVAVGRVLTRIAGGRVREMSEEDRLNLLRLAQQVDAIAREIDRISRDDRPADARLSDFRQEWRGGEDGLVGPGLPAPRTGKGTRSRKTTHMGAPPLPDPQLVRTIIARRQARARFFDAELFADPAWDMLLDLTAAHAENARVSVTSLCIAAGVPATTALRWIRQLVDTGVFERVDDPNDGRRAFIALSQRSVEAMARYFAAIATPLARAA
jgi:hypothetical protein